jgi:hypothetical protein
MTGGEIMTSEQADRAVDQNPVPNKLIEDIEDEMYRARIRVGEMLADQIQHQAASFVREVGKTPTHVVVSGNFGRALADWARARYPDISRQTNGGVLVTLWGMKVVHTTRPNALEVY